MKVLLIRHGEAEGNREGRYIGRTDAPLTPEGAALLQTRHYPACALLVSSPMQRCIRTAQLLYPGQEISVCPALRECDFGDFEGKNYRELTGDPGYQGWIESGGQAAFPHGEHPADFRRRCTEGFLAVTAAHPAAESIAFVVHGGTIMSVLAGLAGGDFYDYRVPNGGGYAAVLDGTDLIRWEKL